MIYESWPWRRDLMRDADILDRWAAKSMSERRSVLIEKKVFVAAYAMRRLLQAGKLSTSTDRKPVTVDQFPSIKPIGKQDRWDFHLHYDIAAGSSSTLPAYRLLDLIIHSFIFAEWQDEVNNRLMIAFTSDRTRDQHLYLVALTDFVDLIRFVATDDPEMIVWKRDPNTGERKEWRGRKAEAPADFR